MDLRVHEWTVADTDAGARLDVFVAGLLPDRSRASIQKSIKAGQVTVNGASVTPHAFLRAGDLVEFKEVEANPFISARAEATVRVQEGDARLIELRSNDAELLDAIGDSLV